MGQNLVTTYGYDALSYRLNQIQVSGSLFDMRYKYDAVGNVIRMTDTVNSGQVVTYNYDGLDRLTSASTSAAGNGQYNESYTYNAIGNVTNKSNIGSYTYGDSAHKHAVTAAGSQSYSYDANGNMIARTEYGATFYQTWDPDNRIDAMITGTAATYYLYNGDGQRTRRTSYTNGATWVSDVFTRLDTSLWTFTTTYQMTTTDGGQSVLKSLGSGSNWDGNFYRNAFSLTTGKSVSVDFKVDSTDTVAHFAIESSTGGSRWALIAMAGVLRVQYNYNGSGWVYPKDLINPVKVNTWYRVTLRVDDLNGFRIEVRERDSAGASGSYTFAMPKGQTWRFHHWIYRNTAYLDNYIERTDTTLSTVYIGNYFERDLAVSNGDRKYYYLGGKRIAEDKVSGLYFLQGDHLGSTSLTTSITGSVVSRVLYNPFGTTRWTSGSQPTDYLYTGQRVESTAGWIYDYGARFYDPYIGRFISADSIVPGAGNPQGLNRYSYGLNNPVKYIDPTGHDVEDYYIVVTACDTVSGHCSDKPDWPAFDEFLANNLKSKFENEEQWNQWLSSHLNTIQVQVNDPAKVAAAVNAVAGKGGKIYLVGYSAGGTSIMDYLKQVQTNGTNPPIASAITVQSPLGEQSNAFADSIGFHRHQTVPAVVNGFDDVAQVDRFGDDFRAWTAQRGINVLTVSYAGDIVSAKGADPAGGVPFEFPNDPSHNPRSNIPIMGYFIGAHSYSYGPYGSNLLFGSLWGGGWLR